MGLRFDFSRKNKRLRLREGESSQGSMGQALKAEVAALRAQVKDLEDDLKVKWDILKMSRELYELARGDAKKERTSVKVTCDHVAILEMESQMEEVEEEIVDLKGHLEKAVVEGKEARFTAMSAVANFKAFGKFW